MDNITPEKFLQTVFPLEFLGSTRPMITTRMADGRWYNSPYYSASRRRAVPQGTEATYFCVSTVGHGVRTRRLQDVQQAWVVVCDDVGTKVTEPSVRPSYIIETSAGNYQYGYLIEPFDVTTSSGRAEYDSILYSLVKAGHNDPGCRSATRVVRLPGSLHRTGFVAEVLLWEPQRSWWLDELLPAMGVDHVYSSAHSGGGFESAQGLYNRLDDVCDPAYLWLCDNKRVLGHNDMWVHIECPWRGGHTDGVQGLTSTSYSPADYNTANPAFKCQHGHCAKRNTLDFRRWLEGEGCVIDWGDPELGEAQRNLIKSFMESR